MSANSYYGFTHGGTQYGATGTYQAAPIGAAAAPAAGYATVAAQPTAVAYTAAPATPRSAYENNYQAPAAHATYAAGATQGTVTYDYQSYQRAAGSAGQPPAGTAYYTPTATVAYTTQSYAVASKPAYSSTANYAVAAVTPTAATPQQTQTVAQPPKKNVQSYTSAKVTQNQPYAQPMQQQEYHQPQAQQKSAVNSGTFSTNQSVQPSYIRNLTQIASTGSYQQNSGRGGGAANRGGRYWNKGRGGAQAASGAPRSQQLHYCDVCKISCAGPLTYREHLEGQKHKKKEIALKGGTAAVLPKGGSALRCDLCDVACTGSDAYAAHIRGSKHLKVVKLHQRLGKPIPSNEPTVISNSKKIETKKPGTSITPTKSPGAAGTTTVAVKKTVGVPKVNFVGGTVLQTTPGSAQAKEIKKPSTTGSGTVVPKVATATVGSSGDVEMVEIPKLPDEKLHAPVGADYIETTTDDTGKPVSFHCKLCDCKFTDPNAKEMHLKGRRHRLSYKKKVDPTLEVEIKPQWNSRFGGRGKNALVDRKAAAQAKRNFHDEMRLCEEERMFWEGQRQGDTPPGLGGMMPPGPIGGPPRMPPLGGGMPPRFGPPGPMGMGPMAGPRGMGPGLIASSGTRAIDDRHIMSKHAQIVPKEDVFSAIHKFVNHAEKALKAVSDILAQKDSSEGAATGEWSGRNASESEEGTPGAKERALKGVMRIGDLAKGLLLRDENTACLVILCSVKPTVTLLEQVVEALPEQFSKIAPDTKINIVKLPKESCFEITTEGELAMTLRITLTAPVMRTATDDSAHPDPPDVLNRGKCLEALAEVRHAKWFQAKAAPLNACVIVLRILRDFVKRNPKWAPMQPWALELLVQKVIESAGVILGVSEALRSRVFEALASGFLFPDSPGLLDPCEKDQTDALQGMSAQQCEDITASAQVAVRQIAFRQVHKVLGIDAVIPPFRGGPPQQTQARKRPLDSAEMDTEDKQKQLKQEALSIKKEN
ncbi:unnamed protein product [Cyprideis torosa]|uniref:DZF domain-containing protein n=1 Tax=Cyprideis torosa TaxID=163714 RepID=A0A7R8W7T2_9CRUS|nr:unnamed protein product [Cyprideis torosa]CAG0886703.1 unnamed protein product [Cyprideis torosa]